DSEVPPVPWSEHPAPIVSKLRIAWLPEFPAVPTARAVRAATERVAAQLAAAGAHLEQRDPGVSIEEMNAVWADYFPIVAATLLEVAGSTLPVKAPEAPPPGLAQWVRVLERRDTLLTKIDDLLHEFHAFLCPAVMSTAFPHSAPRSPIPVDEELIESRYV